MSRVAFFPEANFDQRPNQNVMYGHRVIVVTNSVADVTALRALRPEGFGGYAMTHYVKSVCGRRLRDLRPLEILAFT